MRPSVAIFVRDKGAVLVGVPRPGPVLASAAGHLAAAAVFSATRPRAAVVIVYENLAIQGGGSGREEGGPSLLVWGILWFLLGSF